MAAGDFLFFGAHRALDFVNTRTVDRGRPVERLTDFEALLRFTRGARLLPAADAEVVFLRWSAAPERTQVVADAIALRETLRRWLHDPGAFSAVAAAIERHLQHPAPRVRIARPEGRIARQVWIDDRPPATLLRALADDAAALLCDVEPHRIRRCASDDCEAWFVATGRASERAWCSQERCGGRHRNATYDRTTRRYRFR
jgi:predicted RNA-binding Zn ribbon-like protein